MCENNVTHTTIGLYIQMKLFTELGTIDIQTYPYMEETYPSEEVNTANHWGLRSTTVWQILTIDPYISRALCRPPLIGSLASIQTLVLPCDPINMEGPIFWWYHNTWRWSHKELVTRIQPQFACLWFFFHTWPLWQSMFILVPCDGWRWDAFGGTAKNHRAAHIDRTIRQITKQHWRLQSYKERDTQHE